MHGLQQFAKLQRMRQQQWCNFNLVTDVASMITMQAAIMEGIEADSDWAEFKNPFEPKQTPTVKRHFIYENMEKFSWPNNERL